MSGGRADWPVQRGGDILYIGDLSVYSGVRHAQADPV